MRMGCGIKYGVEMRKKQPSSLLPVWDLVRLQVLFLFHSQL